MQKPPNDICRRPRVLFVVFDNFKTERLGVQILSSIAGEEGWDRNLIRTAEAEPEILIPKILKWKPAIVAYSGMTFEQYDLQSFNRRLKNTGLDFIAVFGGHHYTFHPEEIETDSAIDVLCRGEGEIPFRMLLRAVASSRDFSDIPNLLVRKNSRIRVNPIGPPAVDLDSIPFPDRDLVPLDPGGQVFGNSLSVLFGRGCPNRCTYCFNSAWNRLYRGQRIIRHRSVDNLLQELKDLKDRFSPSFIYFHDDDIALIPRSMLLEFARRYKSEIGIDFLAQFRAENLDEELIVTLKEAGMKVASIGVECGNRTVADTVLKRGRVSPGAIQKAFALLNRHGVRNYSQNMLCLPVENPMKVDLETIKFNIGLKPTWSSFTILLPLPGTEIHAWAIEKGFLLPNALEHPERLPSVFTRTVLDYHDPALVRRLTNLHKLASLTVKFPFIYPLLPILIRLPLGRFYQLMHFAWYGYWNTVGLFGTKLSPALIFAGLREIRRYRKKF